MVSIKKTAAVLLATLQLSWSFGATDALAQNIVQSARVTGGNSVGVTVVAPLNYSQPSSLSGNSILGGSNIVPTGSLPSLYSPAPDIAIPGTLSPEAVAFSMAQSGNGVAAIPGASRVQTFAAPALSRMAAPVETKGASEAKGAAAVEAASTKVGEAIKSLDLSDKAPAESSKDSADGIFAALVGEKLISPTGAVEAQPSATPATPSASRSVFRRGLAFFRGSPSASQSTAKPEVPAPAVEAQTLAKPSIWQHPSARRAAVLAGTVALAVVAPFLTAHVGLVAAAGSITLSVLGIPQIISNFRNGREGVRDLSIASPLMWFAAASLLSLVSIGNGSSVFWNAANVAGVIESALVVGQLNFYKRDSKALKATLATAAAVALPIALIASQAVAPLAMGLNAAFTAAMAILWVLDAPQIRQNYHIFKTEGRAPQGISPAYKLLLIGGSLMHLFAALMGGDLRWALNASIAIIMGSTVLAQMYAPRAANAVLGPLVRAAESIGELVRRRAPPAAADQASRDLAEARAKVDKEFHGVDYLRFQSRDAAQTLASIQEKAASLPGRSVILLEAPTAAGKSTLAEAMSKTLKGRIVVFPVDRYFRSYADIPADPQGRPDYDRPEALHLKRAADDVKTLLAGGRVELPKHVMDGPTTFDSGEYLRLGPDDVLIVDSIFASHPYFLESVQGHQALNVYLAAPAAARLARRLKRDKTERGITVENNLKGWSHLLSNERSNILPLREKADVVVNLMTAAELERLPQALAELLAQEWVANGRDEAQTKLFLDMIRASIEADHTPGPLPEGDMDKVLNQVDVSGDAVAPERLRILIAKALETYTAVQREAAEMPNFSDFHVHAAVELSNGRWASAPNEAVEKPLS
ncbi:MAG: hypothetical protein HZB91_14700 [Elusimicrobia bacterium]|nr:hypothetical protein [Elusimicrobiota bacterium]